MRVLTDGGRRKLPGFGKVLVEKRRQGLAPRRDLIVSLDWNFGKGWPWRIVVAPEDDPSQLDFAVCAGLSCLLFGRDQPRMDEVARAVIAAGPSRLIGVRLGGKLIDVYFPSSVPAERAA